jgi:geranylgeranyl pyrophosphate synthase
VEFVEHHGGIAYAADRAREFTAGAVECLRALPESAARASLTAFASFVVDRTK